MKQQFFGRTFWIVLAALAVVFGVAALVFQTILVPVALVLMAGVVLVLTVYRLEWGMAAAFAELFANSHGHLLSVEVGGFPISLRMAIFAAVMLGWLINISLRRISLPMRDPHLTPFLLLALAVGIGMLTGVAQNDPLLAFKDGNAYFFVAYIVPMLSIEWNANRRRLLLQTLAASAAWVSILSLGTLYTFTHFPEWMLVEVYQFLRDTRTAEVTRMNDAFFRVFLQAQFTVIIFAFLSAAMLWGKRNINSFWKIGFAVLAVASAVTLLSLSRSFWVGMVFGGAVFLVLLAKQHVLSIKEAGRRAGLTLGAIVGSLVLLVSIVLFPIPYGAGSVGALSGALSDRTSEDVAVTSRWNLVGPMMEVIGRQPILGSGFGEEVEFITDDPRARAISPDGLWRTHAFEWGWLEIWLKMGIIGLAAFVAIFIATLRGLWTHLSGQKAWLAIGFISALVMLYATHVFSPYLNHPLGLGFLIFLIPFLKEPDREEEELVKMKLPELAPKSSAQTATPVAHSK